MWLEAMAGVLGVAVLSSVACIFARYRLRARLVVMVSTRRGRRQSPVVPQVTASRCVVKRGIAQVTQ